MAEALYTRNPYLDQLECDNPGYVATDHGREIVLDPLSRVSEKEREAYQQRVERLGICIVGKIVDKV